MTELDPAKALVAKLRAEVERKRAELETWKRQRIVTRAEALAKALEVAVPPGPPPPPPPPEGAEYTINLGLDRMSATHGAIVTLSGRASVDARALINEEVRILRYRAGVKDWIYTAATTELGSYHYGYSITAEDVATGSIAFNVELWVRGAFEAVSSKVTLTTGAAPPPPPPTAKTYLIYRDADTRSMALLTTKEPTWIPVLYGSETSDQSDNNNLVILGGWVAIPKYWAAHFSDFNSCSQMRCTKYVSMNITRPNGTTVTAIAGCNEVDTYALAQAYPSLPECLPTPPPLGYTCIVPPEWCGQPLSVVPQDIVADYARKLSAHANTFCNQYTGSYDDATGKTTITPDVNPNLLMTAYITAGREPIPFWLLFVVSGIFMSAIYTEPFGKDPNEIFPLR